LEFLVELNVFHAFIYHGFLVSGIWTLSIYRDMHHLKLFEEFSPDHQSIKVYHGSWTLEGAEGIMARGFDLEARFGGKAEGIGMGAFFSLEDAVYGNYVVEFEIPVDLFRRHIVINTERSMHARYGNTGQPSELALFINGKVETIDEQVARINGETPYNDLIASRIKRGGLSNDAEDPEYGYLGEIKGFVRDDRFEGQMTIHLFDPSIAKPLRIISKK